MTGAIFVGLGIRDNNREFAVLFDVPLCFGRLVCVITAWRTPDLQK
jgi:hypothetical protein